jgi:hypothetical protein
MAKTPQMPIRLSTADRAALRRITLHHTLNNDTDAIRWLIRQEDRRIAVGADYSDLRITEEEIRTLQTKQAQPKKAQPTAPASEPEGWD